MEAGSNINSEHEQVRPCLKLKGVAKHFGGVMAFEGIDISIMPGTVHALVGENGAGKSTFVNWQYSLDGRLN